MIKKTKTLAAALSLCMAMILLVSCSSPKEPSATATPEAAGPTASPAPTQPPADIDPDTVDVITQQWIAVDIPFESSVNYTKPLSKAELDVTFTAPDGTVMVMPGFWDGGTTWKVRFAPTQCGVWTYTTTCTDTENTGLNGQTGKLGCNAYKGELAIYQRGFIKTESNVRYFMYDDGTPFFYLGDTHWNMPAEEFDTSKVDGIASHFKYIIDKRVEQGFTVYQSEPLQATYNFDNGVTSADLAGLQDLDAKFLYIAQKGLVHANSQLFGVTTLANKAKYYSAEYLAQLCRMWVARYAAYPVLWTTAQECDDDYYFDKQKQTVFDAESNPWKLAAEKIYQYDPYRHPLTAHQEYASMDDTVGVNATRSSFRNLEGHTWYGAQWSPRKNGQLDFDLPKDFWVNGQGKPVVNYEGHYDYLWTNHFGARMQGWTAYLNGMFGFGYGAIDIWLYNSTYDMKEDSNVSGILITVEMKKTKWTESLEFPTAYHLGYMHQFFDQMEWWKLEPRFDDVSADYYSIFVNGFSGATIGHDAYVLYFYNTDTATGKLANLEAGKTYTTKWFNPRTGEYTVIAADVAGADPKSSWQIPAKPDGEDWVLYVTKNG